jgi:putative ABC transport system permease protein
MKLNLESAQNPLNIPNQVHNFLVVIDKTENTHLVKAELTKLLQGKNLNLELITWEEQGSFYRQAKALFEKIYTTIQFIFCIIFFFSIANTINMSLFERMREFGTMMAIGNSRAIIFSVIFLEALVLGLAGALLGVGFGVIVAKIISAIGIEMPPPPMGSNSYYAMIAIHLNLLVKSFLVAFISTLFSAIIPGYRASHFKIVHALGYV